MSLLTNMEDGIKKGFRIQYELGRLSAVRLQYSSGSTNEILTIEKIDQRIASFEKEMDSINEFFGFNKK